MAKARKPKTETETPAEKPKAASKASTKPDQPEKLLARAWPPDPVDPFVSVGTEHDEQRLLAVCEAAKALLEPPFRRGGGIQIENPEEDAAWGRLRNALLEAGVSWEEWT